jgi:hypothetical protein
MSYHTDLLLQVQIISCVSVVLGFNLLQTFKDHV